MEKEILELYGIEFPYFFQLGSNYAASKNGYLFILQPADESEESLYERMVISQVLQNLGHQDCCKFLKNKEGLEVSYIKKEPFVLLMVPLMEKAQFQYPVGYSLAHFHLSGRKVPIEIKEITRIGKWKDIWIRRLEQLENFWSERIFHVPETEFDEVFISTFPYYRGLAENAIAYLADTELDEEPRASDGATICHYRLTTQLWGTTYLYKNPFDWVFDHQSRDIAEYIRNLVLEDKQNTPSKITSFLKEYQKMYPLTPFGIRLIFSRLLFPLHYFEVVEDYYLINRDDFRNDLTLKMNQILNESNQYEELLKTFFINYFPNYRAHLPMIEWLVPTK